MYTCEICGRSFDTEAELQRHICGIPSATVKLATSLCPYCNEKFADYHICKKPDAINPQHYRQGSAQCTCGHTIECIEIVRNYNFNLGNVIKYIWRADHKGDRLENLKKAHWYLLDEIRKSEVDFGIEP